MATEAAGAQRATASAHVVTYPWRRPWQAIRAIGTTRRLLADAGDAAFSVVGRSSGGGGWRRVNRTLSPRRIVVLVDWADAGAAERGRRVLEADWQRRGASTWTAGLVPIHGHGTWRGATPFAAGVDREPPGQVASLTYARIRPSKMAHFYVLAFPRTARRMTRGDSPMIAGIGFGDVPIHHACTFSVWPSTTELDRMVVGRSEPHGEVARRSIKGRWLSESMFARFAVVDHHGTWGGGDPLGLRSES